MNHRWAANVSTILNLWGNKSVLVETRVRVTFSKKFIQTRRKNIVHIQHLHVGDLRWENSNSNRNDSSSMILIL